MFSIVQNRTTFLTVFLFAIVVLLVSTNAIAQVTTGALQGVVVDQNKAAVAGAAVKITNVDTGQTKETTTNAEGFYRVTNLQPGSNYKVEVSAQGFGVKTFDKVSIQIAQENSQDIELAPGAVTGTVDVSATEQALIQSTQNQLSTSFSQKQLTQLPVNGGLIDNLALLTPGVSGTSDATFTNGVGISANGNRGRSNNFQIDGQDNNDNSVAGPSLFLTNTDAIGGFQVITNNFSAEFGRNSGAQINVTTKSGTNDFHGTGFWFLQNSALNAATNVDKRAQQGFAFLNTHGFPQFSGLASRRVNPFTYNRVGASFGGPIKKDKAFFFVTYQADRQRGELQVNNLTTGQMTFIPQSATIAAGLGFPGGTQILTNTANGGGPFFAQGVGQLLAVPPTLDTNGDGIPDQFAYGVGNLAGNPVTANLFSPSLFVKDAGGNLITLYTGEAVRIRRNDFGEDQLITRGDFNLTNKDVLGIRYIFDDGRNPLASGRTLAGARFDVPTRNNNIGITYTRTLSSRTTNEARFNFSRLFVSFGDVSSRPGPQIGFSGQRDCTSYNAANQCLTANFASLLFGTQNNLPQSRQVDVYQEQDTISSTIGNHALKFGADIKQQRVNNFFLPNFLGAYTFRSGSGGGTVPAGGVVCPLCTFYTSNGASRAGAGTFAFENMLLGRPWRIAFALGNPREITSQDDYFFFVQDDWRVRPTLTLNLGLRYELSTTPFNPLIEQTNAREASAATAIFDTAFPLSSRTATKLPLDKNNWAPRVGFAWSPNFDGLGGHFRDGKTVVRGGFGIAYDPSFFNIVLNTVTAAPFAAAGLVQQTSGGPGSVNFPFLPSTTAQLNTTPGTNGGDPRLFNQTRVASDFYNPYTMSFNVGIQQELFKNTVLEARYVGSRIVGQFQTLNGNPDLRFLARAGVAVAGNAGLFTHGVLPGACSQADCAAPTAANNYNSRGVDATGSRIFGSGRVDPNFGSVRLRLNGAESTYNGLQIRFDTRLGKGLQLTANYSLSRTIDNASEIFSTVGEGQAVADPQDPFNGTSGERGLSAFHQKHVFSSNFVYDLPFKSAQRGAAGHLLGGWQLSGIVTMGSGRPYTPVNAFGTYDPNFENGFIGVGALRPFNGNVTAPVGTIAFGVSSACNVFLGLFGSDPACSQANAVPGNFILYNTQNRGSHGTVVTPAQALQQARLIYNDFGSFSQFGLSLTPGAPGAPFAEAFNLFKTPFGDVARNTFFGAPAYNANLAVSKRTKLTEKTSLELRLEAANVFNHRNFGVPDPVTEDASNGFAVATFQNLPSFSGGSRNLRFGVRFIF